MTQRVAPRLGVAFGEVAIELQAAERFVFAWFGQADDGVIADEGEAAHIAGAEGDLLKDAFGQFDRDIVFNRERRATTTGTSAFPICRSRSASCLRL